ncbi:hypothetical protein QZH63_09705, partial [Eikenella corrodens]|nr:hypothetical protein [Eikenella corrodens]
FSTHSGKKGYLKTVSGSLFCFNTCHTIRIAAHNLHTLNQHALPIHMSTQLLNSKTFLFL